MSASDRTTKIFPFGAFSVFSPATIRRRSRVASFWIHGSPTLHQNLQHSRFLLRWRWQADQSAAVGGPGLAHLSVEIDGPRVCGFGDFVCGHRYSVSAVMTAKNAAALGRKSQGSQLTFPSSICACILGAAGRGDIADLVVC